MSVGHCACPCFEWGHGGICTGAAEASLPERPSQASWAEKPCCRACVDAIAEVSDRAVLLPADPVVAP